MEVEENNPLLVLETKISHRLIFSKAGIPPVDAKLGLNVHSS